MDESIKITNIFNSIEKAIAVKDTLKIINLFDIAKKTTPEKVANRETAVTFLKEQSALNGKISMQEVKI